VLGRYGACEILIANPIDWLYASCLAYLFNFFLDRQFNLMIIDELKTIDEGCPLLTMSSKKIGNLKRK
jgi:hypothetical protein